MKPNLWIHIDYEDNGRFWSNFINRRTKDLNKPYINLCIESIIKYNSDNFNIFLLNDDSFRKILPDLNINVSEIANPVKKRARKLALCKVLYNYGGLMLPKSFLCHTSLINFYNEGIRNNKMFCVENINNTVTNFERKFLADDVIMGCNKFCPKINEYADYLYESLTTNFSESDSFTGKNRVWLYDEYDKLNINILNGRLIGIKDRNNQTIDMKQLLNVNPVGFDQNYVGILINENEIDRKVTLRWFNRLSRKQILSSDTILGNQILLSHGNNLF